MKAPLLLVSGWAHTAEALEPLTDRLARHRSVRVMAIHELHDESDESDGSVRSGLSRYAAGLLGKLEREPGPCILAGWSMGGMIALEAAAAQPERVAALVMISSAPRLPAGPDFMVGVPPRALQSMRLSLHRAPERTLLEFFRNAAFPETPDIERLARDASGIASLASQLEYLIQTDLRHACRELAMPRLLLHGSLDRIIPVGAAAWMKEHSPGAVLREFHDAGHRLPLDLPERVASDIIGFLEGFA